MENLDGEVRAGTAGERVGHRLEQCKAFSPREEVEESQQGGQHQRVNHVDAEGEVGEDLQDARPQQAREPAAFAEEDEDEQPEDGRGGITRPGLDREAQP